jgi:hypothetical protein
MASAPLRNLFPRITSFSNLLAASRRAQKGKRFRSDVLAFNAQLEANIFQLQQELLAFTYAPGAYRRFHIRDPKPPSSQLRPTVTGWCTMPFAP